jgi:hypothetical protein
MSKSPLFPALAAACWLSAACASSTAPQGTGHTGSPIDGADSGSGAPGDGDGNGDGDHGDGDSQNPGNGDGDNGDGDGNGNGDGDSISVDGQCTSTAVKAPPAKSPQVDIVWVVDASGSMLDEQKRVTDNLAKFADDITAASLDVHIVMLTQSPAIPVICPTVPDDPMANTPLEHDPRYRFVKASVDSNNLLDVAVQQFSKYSDFLRPKSAVNFVFLTDDESNYGGQTTPEARASKFQTDMTALLGRSFEAHTISSPGPSACRDPNCSPDVNSGLCVFVMLGCGASAPGTTYYDLAAATNGLTASICESDWSKIFGPLTKAVIESAPLPCNYAVPAPPDGQELDPGLVNVGYSPSDKDPFQTFPKVGGDDECGDDVAWHYDDPNAPKQVLLCPAACKRVAAGGKLDIAFGCKTVVLK